MLVLLSFCLIAAVAIAGFLYAQVRFQATSQERLKEMFKSLAAETLESSTKQFLELAHLGFSSQSELQRTEAARRLAVMDELLKPVTTTLDRFQQQASEMERERQRAFSAIDVELKRVVEASGSLGKETARLKDALKRPHVRGQWGQVQLSNCIELAGMSEFADVTFQDVQTNADGTHIPDMTVRMPGGRQVIVDAKTPIEAFLASLDASSEEARVAELVRHGHHVKEHIRQLSSRGYHETLAGTPDFTVMFLPNESFLYAALEQAPDLMDYALQKKVLIATPPTLIGLLKVIRYGWNEERLAENAQKISEVGKELHKRLCDFVETYDKVGAALSKANAEFEKGRARLNSRVIVQAQRFEQMGVRSHKSLGSNQLAAGESGTDIPL